MIYVCVAKFGSKKFAEFPIQLKIDFSANCQERFQAVVMFSSSSLRPRIKISSKYISKFPNYSSFVLWYAFGLEHRPNSSWRN